MRAGGGWRQRFGHSQAVDGHYVGGHDPRSGQCRRTQVTAGRRGFGAAAREWTGPLTSSAPGCRSLADLAPGEEARIVSLGCAGVLARRLADLGFIPGATVRVVRQFAGGRLIQVSLRGWRLALRRAEARGVIVR